MSFSLKWDPDDTADSLTGFWIKNMDRQLTMRSGHLSSYMRSAKLQYVSELDLFISYEQTNLFEEVP